MADPDSPPTVLIVEDEEEVRALTRDVLEMHGYSVLEALDSADALRLGETHAGRLDLLITDVVMPRMSGPELARRLRARRPELRVLCMSGYPEGAQRAVPTGLDLYRTLTQRECEVLHLAAEGQPSAQIGARLNISPRTVEVHRANLMRKLGLRGQGDLVRYALGRGILTVDG